MSGHADETLEQLRSAIDQVLSRDRSRLLSDLTALAALKRAMPAVEGAASGQHAKRFAEMQRAIESSRAARDRRATSLPKPTFAQSLPVIERRDEIAKTIAAHQVTILCGETGSGKTTQLPQICLALGRGAAGQIAHTQPRRLAARSVAARIAEELSVPLGDAVGVKVRFDDQTSERTVIKLMTDGILLAELASDPDLLAYDTIIIDEAHERSLNVDFLLGYLKRLLPRRPDLKLIVTSATIDPQRFSEFFGGPALAPILMVSGRTFPVEIRYRAPDPRDEQVSAEPGDIADAVRELLLLQPPHSSSGTSPRADILVFLPGEAEIRQAEGAIRSAGVSAEVLPLYARLSSEDQDRIFRPPPTGTRRVILATNVAETSLTVPGIRYVIDTGLARISRYDSKAKVQRLLVEPVSRASANQRTGRCGRVSAGVAVRLFSERSFAEREAFTVPEIQRTSLASVMLQMFALSLGSIEKFPFLDPPEPRAITDGYESLFELGAISRRDGSATLTPIGRQLARLPLDPRMGRILLAGLSEGCLREAAVLAAALSIQDPRERPSAARDAADRAHAIFSHPTSDFLTLLNIWDQFHHVVRTESRGAAFQFCRQQMLSPARMREWTDTHEQLETAAEELRLVEVPIDPTLPARSLQDRIHRALLTGLVSTVCCREDAGATGYEYRGPRVGEVNIFPGSALFKARPRWIIAAEVVQTTRLYARTVASIDPEWLLELAPHILQRAAADPHFDKAAGEASAFERITMNGLVVIPRRRVALKTLDPVKSRELFIRHVLVLNQLELPAEESFDFARDNAALKSRATNAAAKLRRTQLAVSDNQLEAWFDQRLPQSIIDVESLALSIAGGFDPIALRLSPADLLGAELALALDPERFPEEIILQDFVYGQPPVVCPLVYRLAPGKDHDGVSMQLPLLALSSLTTDRPAWLVPGLLTAKVQAIFKLLPKVPRALIEAAGDPADTARQCAELMSFAEGSLSSALSEAVSVVAGVSVAPELWNFAGLPDHLRLRIEVVDELGKSIASGRDLAKLSEQLAKRFAQARAARTRASFDRSEVKTWDFGVLPGPVSTREPESPDPRVSDEPTIPTLIDQGSRGVRLTLSTDPRRAASLTARGVRRLFACACAEELAHRLDALPQMDELERGYQQLGSRADLRDALSCLIVERVFLLAQPAITSPQEFQSRLDAGWGRLSQVSFEVAELVAKTLEPRGRVAHRLSGGTPRLWAASIADIREHAAFLMPEGFLSLIPADRLRDYPRWAVAMRERLLSLREDGSGAETLALQMFAPAWKRFTAWVARNAVDPGNTGQIPVDATDAPAPAGEEGGVRVGGGGKKPKAALPQARRSAPVVNIDAGIWALTPGNLPPAVDAYRWALEDARIAVFAPSEPLNPKRAHPALEKLDKLWTAIPPKTLE